MSLRIMLCGAADVQDFRKAFAGVVSEFGGEPWSFLDGTTQHLNIGSHGNWITNSEKSVGTADLCVFVVKQEYGRISWQAELRRIQESGRAFVLLATESIFDEYQAFKKMFPDLQELPERPLKQVFLALDEASQRQLHFRTFDPSEFRQVLQSELANLLSHGLGAITREEDLRMELDDAGARLQAAVNSVASLSNAKMAAEVERAELLDQIRLRHQVALDQQVEFDHLRSELVASKRESKRLGTMKAVRRGLAGAVLASVLVIGTVLGALLGSRSQPSGEDSLASPQSPTSAGRPSGDGGSAPAGGEILLTPPNPSVLEDLTCRSDKYVAFLGQYSSTNAALAEQRRVGFNQRSDYLRKDDAKMGRTGVYSKIRISPQDRTCARALAGSYNTKSTGQYYLWMGHFDSEREAKGACDSLRLTSFDCFVSRRQ